MITLYRKQNCILCDDIEEKFRDLALSYKVININLNSDLKSLPKNITLPAIKDDEEIISGSASIKKYLSDLEKFVELWRKYQVDACYIDDDGEIC